MKIINTKHGLFLISNPHETIQRQLTNSGQFEYHLVDLAIRLISKTKGVIVDVGANIGTFTIPVALNYPSREIVSFEPQRTVFHHLAANICLNKLTNVITYRAVISDDDGKQIEVPFFDFNERFTGSVSLDESTVAKRSKIAGVAEPRTYAERFDRLKAVRLDDVVNEKVCLLKVDVEGMELSVLKSAERILRRDAPIIIYETWNLPQFELENSQIYEYLASVGYLNYKLGNDTIACHKDDVQGKESIEEALGYE